MWESYGQFILKLQTHAWPNPHDYCFEFPVHAFGYNWTDSADNSGLALKMYIDRIIEEHRKGVYSPDGLQRECKHVILITHSMGGLVARSTCVLHGAQVQVLGVIHGVQPATGSPAAYWRMKAGFERPGWSGPNKAWWDWLRKPREMFNHAVLGRVAAAILGTDGEEVTCLMGNMPGGLQLLPTKDYVDNEGNRQWLTYPRKNGELKLPKDNPYKDIYSLENEAYRLVNPEWLDPRDGDTAIEEEYEENSPWENFSGFLQMAEDFHDKLQTQYHPETYQFYGTDLDSPDKIVFERKDHQHYDRPDNPYMRYMPAYEPKFSRKGTYRVYVDEYERPLTEDTKDAVGIVTMGSPEGEGDGTVPVSSGKALHLGEGRDGNSRTFDIGKENNDDLFYIGHQKIYMTHNAREIVFKCIWNLVEKRIDDEVGEMETVP